MRTTAAVLAALISASATAGELDRSVLEVQAGQDLFVIGALESQAVRDAVQPHLTKVSECAVAHGLAPGNAEIVVKFAIGKDGLVTRSNTVYSTLSHEDAESCVAEHVAHIPFPANPRGLVLVTFPFELRAG